MSFAGHVFDMINRSIQNRELLKSKRERRNKVRDAYFKAVHRKTVFTEKEISPEELAKIKNEIKKKIRRERREDILITFFLLMIGLLAIGYVIKYLGIFR